MSGLVKAFDCQPEVFQGLPCQRLSLACGDSLLIAHQGAQVLSWVSRGRERLFLSPDNRWDGKTAIRGGVPVCFPQFNQRGSLPRHGFARNMAWQPGAAIATSSTTSTNEGAQLQFTLTSNAQTLAIWQQAFVAQLQVTLKPGQLNISLSVNNTEVQNDLLFSGALHTYLAVDDIALTELRGLGDRPEWDALTDTHSVSDEVLYFDGEFDRVYSPPARAMVLQDGTGQLQIEQSADWADTVVWNPGEHKCADMADMPEHGFARMLCVEAAQVFEPVRIPAGGQWTGWQRFTVY